MMTDQSDISSANLFQRIALIVGVVGLGVGFVGSFSGNLERFFQSYLFAFMFWLGLSLGSLVFMMINFVAGGRCGFHRQGSQPRLFSTESRAAHRRRPPR